MTVQLRIGVSACLAGQRVRYDGTDKYQPALYARIAPHAELFPLCPEAALGIPRPPVQLVEDAYGMHAIGVEDISLDVTATLQAYGESQRALLATLHGLVLKARSPSCGIGTTPILGHAGATTGDGLFAAFVRREFPELPIVDEEQLQDPGAVDQFLSHARGVARIRAAGPQ